jgi:site-specific recombinase XerD
MMSELKYVSDYHVVEFEEFMILKNFSKRTIKTYVQIVKQFINWWEKHHLNVPMSDDVVRKYLLHRFDTGKDWQTVNSDYSAIQKWFKNVLMLSWSLTKTATCPQGKETTFHPIQRRCSQNYRSGCYFQTASVTDLCLCHRCTT